MKKRKGGEERGDVGFPDLKPIQENKESQQLSRPPPKEKYARLHKSVKKN